MTALTAALATLFQQEGPWSQAADLHRTASELARGAGDGIGEANALMDLGRMALYPGTIRAPSRRWSAPSCSTGRSGGRRRGERALGDRPTAAHGRGLLDGDPAARAGAGPVPAARRPPR
ncbi:hypothetical protein GXW82_39230 [Streptacidiphilus sp. 4-A2]|nr:hypothetical protein [Streptacidiphilus sp. 4-A2]